MGLFSKLFGKKESRAETVRANTLDEVRSTTSEPMHCEGCLNRLLEVFPDEDSYDLKLDAVNRLYELDRNDWAEALALHLVNDEKCPLTVMKGLLRHYVQQGEIEKVESSLLRLIHEKPSETEMAVKLGGHFLAQRQYQRCLDELEMALNSAPESRHLYAIMGESHLRLGRHEDALNHLRTTCELYEEAFRLHQVLPDEMSSEQLEYTRLYALLEDAARTHLGEERMAEAFEGLRMQPSSFGLMQEAEHYAAQRIDYEPPSLEIHSMEELDEMIASLGGRIEDEPRAKMLLGKKQLRLGRPDLSMTLFREALELDQENYAAFFGWGVSDTLMRQEPLAGEWPELDEGHQHALETVMADWPKLTETERHLVRAAFAPIEGYLPSMAEAGVRIAIHPLDVRLTDIYKERTEMRFEDDDKPPQAVPAFSTKGRAHVRLDEFLLVQPQKFSTARLAGMMLADALEKADPKRHGEARKLLDKARNACPPGMRLPVSKVDDLLADATEAAARIRLYGDAAKGEFTEAYEKAGVFAFLEKR